MPGERSIGIVGAGWAGLAAAIEAVAGGARVTLFEMAPQAGGRARDVPPSRSEPGDASATVVDNGQHICIGAYSETLRLLRTVGVSETEAFVRRPLTLVDAAGHGLRLPAGPPLPAFAWAVLRRRGWRWHERIALLRTAARWSRDGFRCAPEATVAMLAERLPAAVRADFVEPLCVAALNTPAATASGAVFLRVLHDALRAGRGSADLLLPRSSLGALLPAPALAWLQQRGATTLCSRRAERIDRAAPEHGAGWRVDGAAFDCVIVAASSAEAARLVAPHSPAWSARAAALVYEPIVTVYAHSSGTQLPEPMLTLAAGDERPAQFVFDRGQLGGPSGLLAFVVSGAAPWVERGLSATEQATLAQGSEALRMYLGGPLKPVRTIIEKRATFSCTPGLDRPPLEAAPGLFACGDYVAGPYPATLEGAVRSGTAAARAALA